VCTDPVEAIATEEMTLERRDPGRGEGDETIEHRQRDDHRQPQPLEAAGIARAGHSRGEHRLVGLVQVI
jgi:hypothetical protein